MEASKRGRKVQSKFVTIRKFTMLISSMIVHVSGPKKWLILGVSLTHLVESGDLFFLEAEMVDIFQWNVLKNMWQIKSYDVLQAIGALTVKKFSK